MTVVRRLMATAIAVHSAVAAAPKVAFNLSHGQFQDVFVNPSYYDYVLPEYRDICSELGAEYAEIKDGVTAEALAGVKTLVMISPLARSTQKPIAADEKKAIIDFIERGGSVLMFVDEEEYRVILAEYGANDITRRFGIEIGDDIMGLPGNCGAVSFENEIFGGRREVPYSGSRKIKGGIPASVCMEGGWLHGAYVKTGCGGKLFVAGETMVALLMGYPDGERNAHKMMQTRWWGKDSRLYMKELIAWSIKEEPRATSPFVRIAEIEVHPEWLERYLEAARTVGAESVAKEDGVTCIFPMQQKEHPNIIRIVEIYRDEAAYKAHLASPHFRAYKEGTPHMIKSLKLVPMRPLDESGMKHIFNKQK